MQAPLQTNSAWAGCFFPIVLGPMVDTCCYPFLEGLLVLSAKEWCYFRVCVLYKTLPGAGICVLPGSSVPPKVLFLVGAGEMHGFSLLPASKLPMSLWAHGSSNENMHYSVYSFICGPWKTVWKGMRKGQSVVVLLEQTSVPLRVTWSLMLTKSELNFWIPMLWISWLSRFWMIWFSRFWMSNRQAARGGGDMDRQAHGQWAVGWTGAITILHWPIRYQNKMLLKRTSTFEHDQHGSPGTQNKWNLSTEIITFSGPFCLIGFVNVHHLTTIYKPMIHNLKAERRRTWNYVQDAPSSSLSRLVTYFTLPYIFNDTNWKRRNLHCGRPQSAAECAIVATLPRSICGCQGAGTM